MASFKPAQTLKMSVSHVNTQSVCTVEKAVNSQGDKTMTCSMDANHSLSPATPVLTHGDCEQSGRGGRDGQREGLNR